MAGKTSSFRIDADVSPYEEAMQRAVEATAVTADAIKERFETVNSTFERMSGIFETAVAVLAGGELAGKIGELAERAAGMRESAETFGLSTTALQGLQVAAAGAGVTSEVLQRSMGTLEQKMRTAGEEGGKAAEQFNALGISTEQLRDPTFTVLDAMQQMGAGANSNAQLLALLGSRGAALIPLLRELSENHNLVAQSAAKVGALTEEETRAMVAYRGEVTTASSAWQNFETRLAMGVVPSIEAAATGMAQWAADTDNVTSVTDVLKGSLNALGEIIIRIIQFGRDVVDVFVGIGRIGIDAFAGVGSVIDQVTTGSLVGFVKAVQDIRAGDLNKISADLTSGFRGAGTAIATTAMNIKADFENMVAFIGDNSKEAESRINSMLDVLSAQPKEAPAATQGSKAPIPDFSGTKDAADKIWDQIAREAAEKMQRAFAQINASAAQSVKQQEDTAVGGIDRQIAAVQELGRTHQLSASQELAQETQLLNQKWQLLQQYYDRAKTIEQGNTEKLAELNTQEEAAYQKHLADMQKAQDAATTAMAKSYQKVGDQIASSFTTAINGMISKNRTFAQTVMSLGESLVSGLIGNFVKMGVAWVEQEVLKMVASRAAAAGVVQASAGAAGAAGTASFAAAPWPVDLGAGAFGASMAALAGSFAVAEGGYDIPSGINPMVQAHGGEMVLPQHIADPLRENLARDGGGGRGINLSINAVDRHSVERMFSNHNSAIHKALKQYINRGGR